MTTLTRIQKALTFAVGVVASAVTVDFFLDGRFTDSFWPSMAAYYAFMTATNIKD
jgi:hypothetical protein